MTRFIDGPARGVILSLSRAPFFLRVTRNVRAGRTPTFDALDQLDDTADPNEIIHLYALARPVSGCFLDFTDKATGRRMGRMETSAEYRLYSTQPPDETVRDNAAYQAWCREEAERLKETQEKESPP